MTLDILFLLFLAIVLGWQLHSFYVTYKVLGLMKRLHTLNEEGDEDTDVVYNARHVNITVIHEQGIYLVYDDDNNFVCQGTDLTEVAQRFRDRTNNAMGEFMLNDQQNCFYDGKYLDHTQFKKIAVKA